MKCQICKENNANIIFTKIVNSEKITLNICAECARDKGLTVKLTSEDNTHSEVMHENNNIYSNMREETNFPEVTCMHCGLTFAEFKKIGLFGCEHCHEAFEKYVSNLLKQIHGAIVHEGKTPLNVSNDIELKKHILTLRQRMQRCVESEEYEHAAELRDKITILEEKIRSEI
jgi:protein arginine kinase activator